MAARDGFWLSTYTGLRVYPLDLRPEDFCIEDIAHGLSNACRYAGQCVSFYSVAEHCYRGASHTNDPHLAFEFLLHDAAEAYCGDLVRPVTEILDDYRTLRDRMQEVINLKFGFVSGTMTAACHEIDQRMLRTEAEVVFTHKDKWWDTPRYGEPYPNEWVKTRDRARVGSGVDLRFYPAVEAQFDPPRMAERLFLTAYDAIRAAL